MGRLVTLALVAVALCAASFIRAAATDNWLQYQNDRYGTTIEYPDIFRPKPPPENDDGRAFESTDGAKFSVSASYNTLEFNVAGYRDFILKNLPAGDVVTYQASGSNWFVVSGRNGADIFYERHVLSHRGEMTEDFVMSYPAKLNQTYDPIVARMAQSFRPGTGFQTPKGK